MNISEIRANYPQYGDLTDEQLARAMHAKFYSDMAFEDFAGKIGFKQKPVDIAPSSRADLTRRAMANIAPAGYYGPDILMGLRSIPDAGAQLLTRGMEAVAPAGSAFERWAKGQRENVEAMNAKAQEEYRQQYDPENTFGSSIAQGIGAGLVGGPILGRIAPAATMVGRAAQGAAFGAGQGALTPVQQPGSDFWSEKAKQAGIGTLTGGLATPAVEMAGRMISPRTSAEVRKLMGEGVTPTPGQVLGGAWKASEEKATSIPLLGEAIKAGQRRGIEDFNRSIYARIMAPLGDDAVKLAQSVPAGNEGIRKIGDALSAAYEDALERSVPNVITPQFRAAMVNLQGMAPRGQRGEFAAIINRELLDKVTPAGTITPSVAKEAESELGRLASTYRGSGTASERELGRAIKQAQEELRKLVAANNPAIAPRIQAINSGWTQLVQLENAGAMLGAKNGILTPAQYLNAVKRSDKSVRDRAFARGTVLNQDLAQAADAVLSNRYPDSGTIGRGLFGLGIGGGIGMVEPNALIAGTGAALAYTPTMQRALAALMTKRPESVRGLGSALTDLAPYLTPPITAGLLSYQ